MSTLFVGKEPIPPGGTREIRLHVGQRMISGSERAILSRHTLHTLCAQVGRHLGSLSSSRQIGQDNSSFKTRVRLAVTVVAGEAVAIWLRRLLDLN